ncbi:MAG: FAD-dependent oxidoreductase, partial [Pseudomonadota bacterium]
YESATDSPDHPRLFDLLFDARAFWRDWKSGLGSGADGIGYWNGPSIAIGLTAGQSSVFRRLVRHQRARRLEPREADHLGEIDPGAYDSAFWLAEDGQVDNRALVSVLVETLKALGTTFETRSVGEGKIDPAQLACDVVVDARGWRSPGMTPVKGTALSLAPDSRLPRCVVRWGRNYLVPKADRVVLGAHAMKGLSDTSVDDAIIGELMEEGAELYPAIRDIEVLETWSGVRPRSADGAPVLGWIQPGVFQVGGLYRDGVLLAPLLGEWAARSILGEAADPLAEAFDLSRF